MAMLNNQRVDILHPILETFIESLVPGPDITGGGSVPGKMPEGGISSMIKRAQNQ